jgi:hypothetical protein
MGLKAHEKGRRSPAGAPGATMPIPREYFARAPASVGWVGFRVGVVVTVAAALSTRGSKKQAPPPPPPVAVKLVTLAPQQTTSLASVTQLDPIYVDVTRPSAVLSATAGRHKPGCGLTLKPTTASPSPDVLMIMPT